MDSTENFTPKATFQTPKQRDRRKIAREVAAMYDDIARAAGFAPIERRTAWAISIRHYERAGENCETPHEISLASIGSALTSKSDTEKARTDRARDHAGQLFNHAIPRTGFQILTRFKAEEESGRAHEYADHLLPIAALFSEELAGEIDRILSEKGLDRKARREKIEEARARLVAEALTWLPKCEIELVAPTGETYAYVSAPEAKAYCAKNPDFAVRDYSYTPPAEEKPHPFYDQDKKRIKDSIKAAIEKRLDEILERNSFDEARTFGAELQVELPKLIASWVKVAGATGRREEEREKRINHGADFGGVAEPEAIENPPEADADTPPNLGGGALDNFVEDNNLQTPVFEIVENQPSGSINFDNALEAALFYARDGRPVLPICNFNSETGHCTATWHTATCTGKKPMVKGSGNPGEGYTAATTDLEKLRHFYKKYPDAGVGLRLDGHALIDCDLKDGGPESYEFLRDTFDLPETLTQITQSGGHHYVFKLPDGLPKEWLKSWTRITDRIALGGIDLKVGECGLLYAEPTRGSKGIYRWVDVTAEPAILPRECCDFLHEIRYKDEEAKTEKTRQASRIYSAPDAPREFDPDQEKFFRDVAPGESRHKRLYGIAVAIKKQTGAGAEKIKAALNYHASHFSNPLDDPAWIDRVATTIGGAA